MHLWKQYLTQRVFVHLLQRQSLSFSVQNFGYSTAVSLQDCHLRCNHTRFRGSRYSTHWFPSQVHAWLPGDDEGGARTWLSSSRCHPTGALDAGDGSRNQAVDVRVDVQSQVAVFPSSDVHQHDGIAKVQKPVIRYGYIHLKDTQALLVILIITILTLICSSTVSQNQSYRSQNVVFEVVYLLNG